jgi:hypothetical protein
VTSASIRDYFTFQNGNRHGVPVEHVSINIVSHASIQQAVDDFVDDLGLRICLNDFNNDPAQGRLQTNAVHDSFQTPFVKPVFVVINCLSNSPTHAPNAVLLNRWGEPTEGWGTAIDQWRAILDSVQAPPPALTRGQWTSGGFRFVFPGQRGDTNQVLCSSNLLDWTVLATYTGTNGPLIFRDPTAPDNSQRFYRVRRL